MSDQLKDSFENQLQEAQKKNFEHIVKETKPKTPYAKNMFRAFWVGGLVCALGQVGVEIFKYWGYSEKNSITFTLVILIFLGALFTGLGLYDRLGKYAGAGSIVPISGFANSVVAPAVEWKSEGYVQGLAAKIFTIAGPVIVFGICGSVVLGLIKYLFLLGRGGL